MAVKLVTRWVRGREEVRSEEGDGNIFVDWDYPREFLWSMTKKMEPVGFLTRNLFKGSA